MEQGALLAGWPGASDEVLQDNGEDRLTVEDVGREGLHLASRVAGSDKADNADNTFAHLGKLSRRVDLLRGLQ